MPIPSFKRRTLAETLADATLPDALSGKDASLQTTVAHGHHLDTYFTTIISDSFAAYSSSTSKAAEKSSTAGQQDAAAAANAPSLARRPTDDAAPLWVGGYPRMPLPQSGDWLSEHEEPGQSVARFLTRSEQTAKPHGPFTTIVLVVIGEEGFPPTLVAALQVYVSAFFLLPVEVVGPLSITEGEGLPVRRRQHPDTGLQLWAPDCLELASRVVRKDRALARKTIATMGITMLDLTKCEEWNFLYGLARPLDASGVFSMCRFSPAFNNEAVASPAAAEKLILQRCCKVLTHELTHIFGLKHCVHFQCLMNGANHVGELERQPLLECPVCCRKLALQLGWCTAGAPSSSAAAGSAAAPALRLVERYVQQAAALRKLGFEPEAAAIEGTVLPMLARPSAATRQQPAVPSPATTPRK